MAIRVLKFLVILAIGWCLLSGHFTALLLALGLLSCGISIWIYNGVVNGGDSAANEWLSLSRPVGHLRYCIWLLKEIVLANLDVLKAIIDTDRVQPSFFRVSCKDLNETEKVIYANSITLTPGTVTTEISAETLNVHALTTASRNALLDDKMHQKVVSLCRPNQRDQSN